MTQQLHEGQCGLCLHFGEHSSESFSQIVNIRKSHEAREDVLAKCGHPNNERIDLIVTPISGCLGFELANEASAQIPQ